MKENLPSSSSSSSSTGLMTTGGWVGLGTFSCVSALMTPRSWGFEGLGVCSSGAGSSSPSFFGAGKPTEAERKCINLFYLLFLLAIKGLYARQIPPSSTLKLESHHYCLYSATHNCEWNFIACEVLCVTISIACEMFLSLIGMNLKS